MNFTTRLPGFAVCACLLLLSGCSLVPPPATDPTRYYVLSAPSLDAEPAAKAPGALVLGVKRIEITPYLNGKDMVVRERGNEIVYQSFARWAEPLTTSIGRTVAGNLVQAPNVARVYAQPFPFEGKRDYDVMIRVLSCEGERPAGTGDGAGGNSGATVRFSALVEVTEARPGGALVLRKVFTAPPTPWDGKDFGALAAKLSEAVGALGADVVAALPAKTAQ